MTENLLDRLKRTLITATVAAYHRGRAVPGGQRSDAERERDLRAMAELVRHAERDARPLLAVAASGSVIAVLDELMDRGLLDLDAGVTGGLAVELIDTIPRRVIQDIHITEEIRP